MSRCSNASTWTARPGSSSRAIWAIWLRGDLGISVRDGRPVSEVVAERLRWSLLLVGTALAVSTILGVVLGFAAGWRRGSRRDVALLAGVLALDALPAFFVGLMLLLVFSVQLEWLPVYGAVSPEALTGLAWIADAGTTTGDAGRNSHVGWAGIGVRCGPLGDGVGAERGLRVHGPSEGPAGPGRAPPRSPQRDDPSVHGGATGLLHTGGRRHRRSRVFSRTQASARSPSAPSVPVTTPFCRRYSSCCR